MTELEDALFTYAREKVEEEKHRSGNGRAKSGRFVLKPFDQIKLSTKSRYLVKGILPRVGLAVIWGPPKCGKSFWTFDLTMHIALGWEYRKRRVQQGTIVYCALEGGSGFSDRVEAWRRQHLAEQHEPVPFYLLDVPLDLVADRAALIQTIQEQVDGGPPACVVIDTLNRALAGSENKPEDMAKFIRAADAIRTAFDCLVAIVHHCGVEGGRPRGHSSLPGADDVQIAVERNKDGIIVAKIEHMKDGEAGTAIGSRLDRVELDQDDDGDLITSCVIAACDVPKPARSVTGHAKLALEQLEEVIAAEGVIPPACNHIPPNTKVCSAVVWREHFYNTYPDSPDRKQDTKQRAFVRATLKLQEAHLIGLWSNKVWLARQTGHTQTSG